MYLTRFQFNPARRGAQRLLASPHSLHAAVLAGFPDPTPTATGRVLWRLDNVAHVARLYIVSPGRPDLTHLAEQGGWPSLDESWHVRDYSPLLDRLENGQRYRFRLTANPVRNTKEAPGQRGKPYGHVTVAQQEEWLVARQERAGFQIAEAMSGGLALTVLDRRLITFRRRETQVTLRVASYEGTLTVTDDEAFRAMLCMGLGRARGYGCGLMTIAAVEG